MNATALALLVGVAVGAGGTWLYCTRAAESEARQQAERHATELAARVLRLREAQTRGDALTRQLDAALNSNRRLREERDHALQNVTTGRECLGPAAVRVLNRRAAPVRVPTPAGQPAAAPAGHAATDRDVALWAGDAIRRYEECAARLTALIAWHETELQQGGMP